MAKKNNKNKIVLMKGEAEFHYIALVIMILMMLVMILMGVRFYAYTSRA